MAITMSPKVPEIVRNSIRQAYGIMKGEEMRLERYDEEMTELDINLRNEVERGTLFDNIGKLI